MSRTPFTSFIPRTMSRGAILVATCGVVLLTLFPSILVAAAPEVSFPRDLGSYEDAGGIWTTLQNRVEEEPFNLAATLIFFLAILHTFLASRFMTISHRWEHEHDERVRRGEAPRHSVHHGAKVFHFLGEVEAVFGLWAIALVVAIVVFHDWSTVVHYIGHDVNFTEPVFVVVIMTLAATRPILRLAERIIKGIAGLFGGTLTAFWVVTLAVGPILGSFITEPAAMTISAMLLARAFYELEPSGKFKYGTLGLLLVNVSVGGTLSHFAAPPVLMVAAPWDWTTPFMLTHFGWKAVIGIIAANALYLAVFRKELAALEGKYAVVRIKEEIQKVHLQREQMDAEFDKIARTVYEEHNATESIDESLTKIAREVRARLRESFVPQLVEKGIDVEIIRAAFNKRFEEIRLREARRLFPGVLPVEQRPEFHDPDWDNRDDPVPVWVTLVHVLFMGWTIFTAHYPPLFILGFLFFVGFAEVSQNYQNRINLKPAMLVGFFLAGLVIHGGVQGWWIAPILGGLGELPLMAMATVLTAFNDNAAITYLATLVPTFTDGLKYAVVAGAVTGGGLTIIANAPNPAGIALLKKYFDNAVSPLGILAGSLVPTVIFFLLFAVIR
jgi:hypothetical protein